MPLNLRLFGLSHTTIRSRLRPGAVTFFHGGSADTRAIAAHAAWIMRGVTATEIRIGQTMPYSGQVSAFRALGKEEVGYFKMINERGGINGRNAAATPRL